MRHQHSWKTLVSNAVGTWEKRDCPGGLVAFIGKVEICDCGLMHFVPRKKELHTVECYPSATGIMGATAFSYA